MKSLSCQTQNRSLCHILTVENTEGLLQGFNLFLAACNTVLIAFTCIHTRWLELLIVCKGGIKFLLRAIEICLGLLEGLLMVLLLARLVLDVLGLLSLVHGRIAHELIILFLGLCFCSAGLRFKACEIRLDDLDHTNDTSIFATHALVWLIKDLRLLHEGGGLSSLGIEILEHAERLGHCSLCILGILDGDGVLRFLLLSHTGRFCNCSIKFGNCLSKICDLFSELCNAGFELVNLGMECFNSLGLLLPCLLIG